MTTTKRSTIPVTLSATPLVHGVLTALAEVDGGGGDASRSATLERLLREDIEAAAPGIWSSAARLAHSAKLRGVDPSGVSAEVARFVGGALAEGDHQTGQIEPQPRGIAQDRAITSRRTTVSGVTLDALNAAREEAGALSHNDHRGPESPVPTLAGYADLPGCSHKPATTLGPPIVQIRSHGTSPTAMEAIVQRAQGARDAIPGRTTTLEAGLRASVEAADAGVLLCGSCAAKVNACTTGADAGKVQLCPVCLPRVTAALRRPGAIESMSSAAAIVHYPKDLGDASGSGPCVGGDILGVKGST